MSANDDLPQNVCPFCSHQIKATYYFILKCQESDRKLRLSVPSKPVKRNDIANVDDECVDNEASDLEYIVGEDSNAQSDRLEHDPNQGTAILKRELDALDEICAETAKYFIFVERRKLKEIH